MLVYGVDLVPDDNGTFLVVSPDLPELATFGETEADALGCARDALEEAIAARLDRWHEVPRPSGRGGHPVALPTQTALKLELYWLLHDEGVTRAELARRLGWHRPQVDRLFDLDHRTRLDQFDAAFRVLGRALAVAPVEADA